MRVRILVNVDWDEVADRIDVRRALEKLDENTRGILLDRFSGMLDSEIKAKYGMKKNCNVSRYVEKYLGELKTLL
jgi:adenosyl cobinamide kinase/adenosyl cobinamide phosphate guanylyltransferase